MLKTFPQGYDGLTSSILAARDASWALFPRAADLDIVSHARGDLKNLHPDEIGVPVDEEVWKKMLKEYIIEQEKQEGDGLGGKTRRRVETRAGESFTEENEGESRISEAVAVPPEVIWL